MAATRRRKQSWRSVAASLCCQPIGLLDIVILMHSTALARWLRRAAAQMSAMHACANYDDSISIADRKLENEALRANASFAY